MLAAFSPEGLSVEQQVRLADQTLDTVGLPGTSTMDLEDNELSRLAGAIKSLADPGRLGTQMDFLKGRTDTTWQSEKRTSLLSIKDYDDLKERCRVLVANQHLVIDNVTTTISMVLLGFGFEYDDAVELAHESIYLRISKDSQTYYIALHQHLLGTAQEHGFEYARSEIKWHCSKLKTIRGIYQTRLQVIAHNYCYLRDQSATQFQAMGVQDLRIRELHSTVLSLQSGMSTSSGGNSNRTGAGNTHEGSTSGSTTTSGSGSTNRTHFCSHCGTGLHPGNKSNCWWKQLSSRDAKRAAATLAQNLAANPITQARANAAATQSSTGGTSSGT
jgi:hypothetical protein